MTSLAHHGPRTFPKGASELPGNRRVKLTAGVLALAGVGDDEIGVTEQRALAADTGAAVRLPSASETIRLTAVEAIAAYADIFPAADGKVGATDNGDRWGIALEAASGDGSIIEVLRLGVQATNA